MSSDMFFPPSDCQAEWRLIPDAEFRPIQTIDGHFALFGADASAIGQIDGHLRETPRKPGLSRPWATRRSLRRFRFRTTFEQTGCNRC